MNIIEILLLGFIGALALILGFLAYEIWSVLQIYHKVTDVASVKNLKKIQRVALWVMKWWKNRKSKTATILLLAIVFTACSGNGDNKSMKHFKAYYSVANEVLPDPGRVLAEDGDPTIWHRAKFYIIDSCEYILINECWVHKGNCKYCKKRRDEEIDCIINACSSTNRMP